MKTTGPVTKLLISAINVFTTFIFSMPFLIYYGAGLQWKIAWILLFFLYNLVVEFRYGKCLGMLVFNTYYEKRSSVLQKFIYVILYTTSFSTLFFHIWFPFDIFLINIFLIQLPCVLLTDTTLHGFLAGGKRTVKN